jgi:hypothetical protein
MRSLLSFLLAVWVFEPALAFDDHDFCLATQQLARAAERDVGIWVDRTTRNAGMVVSCDKRRVEFRRFTYAPSASMTEAWKASKGSDWNASQCGSASWGGAIRSGWQVILSVTAADGGTVAFTAQCN